MFKETTTPQAVCDLLNELLKSDYKCIENLFNFREICNDSLADHPSVQVQQFIDDEFPKLGLLGILNGLFGTALDGSGAICYETDGNSILKFRLTPEAEKIPHNSGCICYSTSHSMMGSFFLIRHDCPVHKGAL